MYKIGEFSILGKTTVKTLRYYEKERLLVPIYIDKWSGYRFYDSKQLTDLSKILALRQLGLSICDIKNIIKRNVDFETVLIKRKSELEKELNIYNNQLSKIKYLLEEKNMKYEIVEKILPDYTVYYMEGIIEDFSKITEFILKSAEECKKINPNIKCVTPEYCYVNYLDGEYKEKNIKIKYAQAVIQEGNSNEIIKFEKLKPIKAICIYHKGSYSNLSEAYSFILKYIEDNKLKISEPIRERYIDGMWNKENEEDWLTEIQIPVE